MGGMSGGLEELGRGTGDFKACFQNRIFSLNPHKEKLSSLGAEHYFCLLRGLGHSNNTNQAHGCMYMAVGSSNAVKQSWEL